jgi:hypothetical protein
MVCSGGSAHAYCRLKKEAGASRKLLNPNSSNTICSQRSQVRGKAGQGQHKVSTSLGPHKHAGQQTQPSYAHSYVGRGRVQLLWCMTSPVGGPQATMTQKLWRNQPGRRQVYLPSTPSLEAQDDGHMLTTSSSQKEQQPLALAERMLATAPACAHILPTSSVAARTASKLNRGSVITRLQFNKQQQTCKSEQVVQTEGMYVGSACCALQHK